MKYTVARRYTVQSAHILPHVAEGHKCRTMHGHTYDILIGFSGKLDMVGMVMDFAWCDQLSQEAINKLDHKILNDMIQNPTSENVGAWILDHVPLATWVEIRENDRSLVRVER